MVERSAQPPEEIGQFFSRQWTVYERMVRFNLLRHKEMFACLREDLCESCSCQWPWACGISGAEVAVGEGLGDGFPGLRGRRRVIETFRRSRCVSGEEATAHVVAGCGDEGCQSAIDETFTNVPV